MDAVDAEVAARRWAEGWSAAWAAHDADAVAALYADDAVFVSHPFREPHLGPAGARSYAEWAFADEDALLEVRFGEPVVAGERATVEYWAVVRADGREQTIAGIALLRFAADGRVAEQRDYWALQDGRFDLAPGWGS